MRLPETLKVGGLTYVVEVDQTATDRAGVFGMISFERCRTKRGPSPPNAPGRIRATLVHEALHAVIDYYNGGENDTIDEPTVTNLACGIYQLLRDNPDFVAAVLAEDDEESVSRDTPGQEQVAPSASLNGERLAQALTTGD